jgi:hypothetical protein
MGDTTMATFEVLTRRPDGHETVHRFQAADAGKAKAAAVESGVPADQIVQASPELASEAPTDANASVEPESTPKPETRH